MTCKIQKKLNISLGLTNTNKTISLYIKSKQRCSREKHTSCQKRLLKLKKNKSDCDRITTSLVLHQLLEIKRMLCGLKLEEDIFGNSAAADISFNAHLLLIILRYV